MEKKSVVICLICVICVPWLLASCVKDDLYDTPHPGKGVVNVSIDLPPGAGDDYIVEVDGQPLNEGNTASAPLPPGGHTIGVYNTPAGFTVTDGIASVDRVDATRAETDLIIPLPEPLYAGVRQVQVSADDTLHLELSVVQRTRDLRLELTVTEGDAERIAAITGTLSGVAGAYDLRNEILYGEAVSTAPMFTRSGDKVAADLRLLGTMGDRQTLTLVLSFVGGNPQDILIKSDLTEQLADFSIGTEAVTLTGNLQAPIEARVEADIIDWKVVSGGSVEAQ